MLENLGKANEERKKKEMSTLMMLQDSHTSVVGMRDAVACERIIVVPDFDKLNSFLDETLLEKKNCIESWENEGEGNGKKNLFVLTGMSNFCGRKYDLEIIEKFKEG